MYFAMRALRPICVDARAVPVGHVFSVGANDALGLLACYRAELVEADLATVRRAAAAETYRALGKRMPAPCGGPR